MCSFGTEEKGSVSMEEVDFVDEFHELGTLRVFKKIELHFFVGGEFLEHDARFFVTFPGNVKSF